ncbi:hypothetical protein EJB05_50541, partial [Eragrostis curvula]
MASKRSKQSAPGPVSAASLLPDDIVEAILLRLPASSTFRFRAVCRSWAALLSSPGFANAYARKRGASKFLFFAPSPGGATAVYSCRQGGEGAELLFTVDGLRPDFLLVSSKPCNGLVLLTDTRSCSYWVCNPSTGEFRRLPQQRRARGGLSSAGLAYDDLTRQHKVVHLFCHEEGGYPGCEVYTLCNPSRQWRPASAGGVPKRLRDVATCALVFEAAVTKVPPVFANGRLHWQIYPHMDIDHDLFRDTVAYPYYRVAVLCFSIADEAFSQVAGPAVDDMCCELEDTSPAVPLHLVELQGSLCMVRDLRHLPHEESLMEVWALRDYRASAWALVHRVAMTPHVAGGLHDPRFLTVIGSSFARGRREKNIVLLIATSRHKVHAYHPATGEVQTVLDVPEGVVGLQGESVAGLRLGLYEDSLARTGGQSRRQMEVASALTEILLRLPIKSIAHCALVCKEWHTLIESEGFVTSHLLANRRQRRKVMMVTNGRARKNFFGFMPVDAWLGAPPNSLLLVDEKVVVCSKPCHGLNLISASSDDYLCNPCTGSIRCLGVRGKMLHYKDHQPSRRNVGLGFDRLTREHVAVEISHFVGGAPVCMVKTSCAEYWSRVGDPPMPVTDMPPAHVDGTLYWMSSEPEAEQARDRFVVAFHILTRAFSVFPCQPCGGTGDPFLVELEGALALVLGNGEENVLRIWMMREHGTWVNSYNISLDKHPEFSLRRRQVTVPLEVVAGDDSSSRILLNTGRALGYYDTRTGAIDVVYSLDQLQLNRCNQLAFPILCEESLCRIQDDEQPDHVAPPLWDEGRQRDDGGADVSGRYIFRSCEKGGCQGPAAAYSSCCRRALCRECHLLCDEHTVDSFLHAQMPPGTPRSVKGIAEMLQLPLEHPSVPGPEYCYYYSMRDEDEDDVGRHVFVALKDLVRDRQPRRVIECGYRTDGKVVRETWVHRYHAHDEGNF